MIIYVGKDQKLTLKQRLYIAFFDAARDIEALEPCDFSKN